MERREKLLSLLKRSKRPLSGTWLARKLGVSRQVIVQDVALLRAHGERVHSTPRGYIFSPNLQGGTFRDVLAVRHEPRKTGEELYVLVDRGITVVDVVVEHPVYGELRGYLYLKSRRDVDLFLERVKRDKAPLLSVLTDGYHWHTVEAGRADLIEEAKAELARLGFLVS